MTLRPDSAEGSRALGEVSEALGKTEAAIKAYGRAVELDPEYAEGNVALGRLFEATDRPQEAVAALQQAVQRVPRRAELQASLGAALLRVGKADEALAHLRQAVTSIRTTRSSRCTWALHSRGSARPRRPMRRCAAARGSVRQRARPEGPGGRGRGTRQERRGSRSVRQGSRARRHHGGRTRRSRKAARAHGAGRARRRGLRASHPAAQRRLRNARRLGSGCISAFGQHDDAARELARASELKGSDPDTLFELGVAHAKGTRWGQARDALEKAVHLRGEHAPSWKLLARATRETGPEASAVSAYERALALAPDWAEGVRDVAPLYAAVGRDADAAKAFEALTEADGRARRPSSGRSYRRLGAFDRAAASYGRAVGLPSANAATWEGLGISLAKLKRHDDARGALKKAVGLDAGRVDAWKTLAEVASRLGEHEEAVEAYERALALDATFTEAHLAIGRLHALLGRDADAARAFGPPPQPRRETLPRR